MAVPDYQELMLPLLKLAAADGDHLLSEATDRLADEFRLAGAEREELLPSGRQPRFHNRVSWARTYLVKAGLLQSSGRGRFRITSRGRAALDAGPKRIDNEYLNQFPEFREFKKRSPQPPAPSPSPEQTPEEALEEIYLSLRRELAQDLLERIKRCSPRFFERLVVDLLVAMGYGGSRQDAGRAVGQSGDGGIDGVIKEDKLGLDAVYIQAKRWEGVVRSPVVQTFAGSLEGQRARKGVLITTSQFSQAARDYVDKIEKKIVLIDGNELASLMVEHNVGVTEVAAYSVKRVDVDYFDEG